MTPQELLLAAADLIHNAPKLAKRTFGADAGMTAARKNLVA